ncbi:MAG: hypothetical protein H7836_05305 [Magnetococcus sp. YQC-3]
MRWPLWGGGAPQEKIRLKAVLGLAKSLATAGSDLAYSALLEKLLTIPFLVGRFGDEGFGATVLEVMQDGLTPQAKAKVFLAEDAMRGLTCGVRYRASRVLALEVLQAMQADAQAEVLADTRVRQELAALGVMDIVRTIVEGLPGELQVRIPEYMVAGNGESIMLRHPLSSAPQ